MDDVIDKYHDLMKASQEMLEVSALAQNDVHLTPAEVQRRMLHLEGASKAFARACASSGGEKANGANGAVAATQLALV